MKRPVHSKPLKLYPIKDHPLRKKNALMLENLTPICMNHAHACKGSREIPNLLRLWVMICLSYT